MRVMFCNEYVKFHQISTHGKEITHVVEEILQNQTGRIVAVFIF